MTIKIKSILFIFATVISFVACKKTDYAFGDLKTPTNLTVMATIAGVDAANPNGNGTGAVAINSTAANALTYKIDFGDGTTQLVPSGIINYKYNASGTNEFTITVNAIGTGGTISTISKKIKVFVAFEIPADIVQLLTNGTTKVWVTDKAAPGHFGVGAPDGFTPNYYSADPNSRQPCAYDDEISFIKDATSNVAKISMSIDNKGQSFSIGAASAFYGFSGGDNCFNISTIGVKKLSFMNATSGSTTDNSTKIQFMVPGNGIINFGTGGTVYEILSISTTSISLRNMGIDGNAWYQKLKAK